MSEKHVLQLAHVSLTFGDHAILHDVSCQVGQGEVVGLIGPNGSGKTTLLNVLSGFLLPTHGTVRLHGEDITRLSPEARSRKSIARVFQNFGVFREMTVAENILVALEALPKAKRMHMGDVRSNVQKALRLVGLEQHAQKLAGSLSGGQMRLLEITRTLACGQEVFLLDEPTAGVSPKLTQQVADLIMLLKQAGKTVVIVEHDLPFISRICDRVIVMDIGKIVLSGTAAEVRKSPELKELYFGADPTT